MSENREWDFVHSTCYLYIAFACETDGVFTDEEKATIFQCVKEWVPDTDDNDIGAALKTASEWLTEDCQGNGDGNKITNTVGGIAAQVPKYIVQFGSIGKSNLGRRLLA